MSNLPRYSITIDAIVDKLKIDKTRENWRKEANSMISKGQFQACVEEKVYVMIITALLSMRLFANRD